VFKLHSTISIHLL